jgi:hypothetical protein
VVVVAVRATITSDIVALYSLQRPGTATEACEVR